MQVKDVMTSDPACCTPDSTLQRVAEMMVENDCGEIPVVENIASMKPMGVITDRDITCRTVAKGLNPLTMTVGECMTTPCVTVTPDTSLDDCCRVLEENQIRRVPVVDAEGACCGIIALADIAKHAPKRETAEVVKEVSEPSSSASAAG
ncbi:MAG TPA: CBS domain-containing protein [Pyrinomonadaceae bacterium]|jgi:CBS domain-containing protein